VEIGITRYRLMSLAGIQKTAVPPGLGAYRALPDDILEKPVARNGIQEVARSIRVSSRKK
jgi:hypothetical protein